MKMTTKSLSTPGLALAKLPSSTRSQWTCGFARRAAVSRVFPALRFLSPGRLAASVARLLVFVLGAGLAVPATHAAVHYQRLKSFGAPDQGVYPQAPLIQGND